MVTAFLVIYGPSAAVFLVYLAAVRFGSKTHTAKVDTLDHRPCNGC